MTTDLYHEIYTSEVYDASQCIWHENNLMNLLTGFLINLGYEPVQDGHKTWRRGDRTVVICFVDDYISTTSDYDTPVSRRFDAKTVVVTDNYVTSPTLYPVLQLPSSWFGIYAYQPKLTDYNPTRRFNFPVNRIDSKRLLLMLEIAARSDKFPNRDTLDWINFNCWSWEGDNSTAEGRQESFSKVYQALEPQYRDVYEETYQRLLPDMPFRNHDMDMETVHLSAYVNMIVETYSSDTSIALSEKTFRALTTPAPWLLYAGKYAVAYLESLGFDTLNDIVNHGYDVISENKTAAYGDKLVEWVHCGNDTFTRLSEMDRTQLRHRCAVASRQNQTVLKRMRSQWPRDFAAWLPQFVALVE
jgi:hypothetical protein